MSNRWLQKPPLGVQIDWSHPLSKGLVGCWLMNEGSGNKIFDLAQPTIGTGTFGNHTHWSPLQNGMGVTFDATDDYISIPNNGLYSFGNSSVDRPFSVLVVEYHPAFTSTSGVVGKNQAIPGFSEWYLVYSGNPTKALLVLFDGAVGDINITSSITIPGNRLNYVVATYAGTGVKEGLNLYINGIKDSSPTRARSGTYVAMHATASTLDFGEQLRDSHHYTFPGSISCVFLFNKELNADEVMWLYINPYCFLQPVRRFWQVQAVVSNIIPQIWWSQRRHPQCVP